MLWDLQKLPLQPRADHFCGFLTQLLHDLLKNSCFSDWPLASIEQLLHLSPPGNGGTCQTYAEHGRT